MNYSYLTGFLVCLILITNGAFALTDSFEDNDFNSLPRSPKWITTGPTVYTSSLQAKTGTYSLFVQGNTTVDLNKQLYLKDTNVYSTWIKLNNIVGGGNNDGAIYLISTTGNPIINFGCRQGYWAVYHTSNWDNLGTNTCTTDWRQLIVKYIPGATSADYNLYNETGTLLTSETLPIYALGNAGTVGTFKLQVDGVGANAYFDDVFYTNNTADFNYFKLDFNVKGKLNLNHLSDFNIDCNVNTYDGVFNSPKTITMLEGTYLCSFSKPNYDSNTNILINADSNKTYTVYLNEALDSNFTYTNNQLLSIVELKDTSNYPLITSWVWEVDGTIVSTDQNTNYSTQANLDLNVCLLTNGLAQTCKSVKTWDTISPTIDANINPATYGFVSDFDINYSMTCYDNFTPIQYLITWNNGTTNATLYDSSDANASLKTGTLDLNVGQNATLTFTCTDDSNNIAQYVSPLLYALRFRLINENTGALFDLNKVTAAQAYSYDGNFIYNFKDSNQVQTNFFSSSNTIRFDFTYPDESATKISREITFDYLDDSNVGICVAEYQQFYLYRFLSTSVKPVVVYNDYANCYNLASTTKFLYNTYQSNTAYTINKPYYLYTYSNGVKTLLALLDGANNTEINLDVLAFNQQEYTYAVDMDTLAFKPSETDSNTITFYFYSPNDNDSVTLDIYNGNTLLWNYTELVDTNSFEVNFYYGDIGVTDANLLKVVVSIVLNGETTSFYKYFNTKAETYSGILNPMVAIVISFFVMFFGITMVSYRFAMGWFGLFISLIAIGILALAPSYDYIIFLQAIYFIIGIFIGVVGKEQNLGVN